jgi:hypothetical protein
LLWLDVRPSDGAVVPISQVEPTQDGLLALAELSPARHGYQPRSRPRNPARLVAACRVLTAPARAALSHSPTSRPPPRGGRENRCPDLERREPNNNTKGPGEHMTTTVDISTIDLHGNRVPVLHCVAASITGALRIIDGAAPAPANRHVRRRLHREHGGLVQIGMVSVQVDVHD